MLTTILQAASAGGAQQGGSWGMIIWLVVLFAIMWFLMIRPQRKQQKALEEMRKTLKKGDRVITAGGIHGVVAEVEETTVLIKVDGEVKLRMDRNSITVVGNSDTQRK